MNTVFTASGSLISTSFSPLGENVSVNASPSRRLHPSISHVGASAHASVCSTAGARGPGGSPASAPAVASSRHVGSGRRLRSWRLPCATSYPPARAGASGGRRLGACCAASPCDAPCFAASWSSTLPTACLTLCVAWLTACLTPGEIAYASSVAAMPDRRDRQRQPTPGAGRSRGRRRRREPGVR